MIITVDNLIAEVRSLLDEQNRVSVKDDEDILPALNRGQSYAANILARHYESPMLHKIPVLTVAGQEEYDIPEDAFEQRLEKIEIQINGQYQEIKRLSYRDISVYESRTATPFPYYYVEIANRFRLIPRSTGTYPIRLWYLVDPMQLVKPQGRINIVNEANNYIILDSVGEDLTTESDQLNSYVNIVDAQTGIRKATFQVQNIAGNKVTFKTVPIRTNVLNYEIDTNMTDLLVNGANNVGPDYTINPDDYICLVHGGCIPFFKKPFSNFIIEYAVMELRRKLGDSTADEKEVLARLEEQVKHSWVGREQSLRVKNSNNKWNNILKKW